MKLNDDNGRMMVEEVKQENHMPYFELSHNMQKECVDIYFCVGEKRCLTLTSLHDNNKTDIPTIISKSKLSEEQKKAIKQAAMFLAQKKQLPDINLNDPFIRVAINIIAADVYGELAFFQKDDGINPKVTSNPNKPYSYSPFIEIEKDTIAYVTQQDGKYVRAVLLTPWARKELPPLSIIMIIDYKKTFLNTHTYPAILPLLKRYDIQ